MIEPMNRRADRVLIVLVALIVARAVVPGVVTYRTQIHRALFTSDVNVRPHDANSVAAALSAVLALWVLVALVTKAPRREDIRGLVVVGLLLALPAVHFRSLPKHQWLDIVLSGAVALALWRRRAGAPELAALGLFAAIACAWAVTQGLLYPAHAMFADHYGNFGRSTKSLIGTDQLAGPFGHSNTLGIFAALAVPLVALQPRRAVRWGAYSVLVWAAAWSSCRGALIALVLYFLVKAVRFLAPKKLANLGKWWVVGALVAVAAIPLTTTDPTAFTRRGEIWIVSLQAWRSAWAFGFGDDWYSQAGHFVNNLGDEASSGHNLLIGALATSGAFGAALILWSLLRGSRLLAKGEDQWPDRTLYFGVFLTVSVLEYLWGFAMGAELSPVVAVPIIVALVCPDALEQDQVEESGQSPLSVGRADESPTPRP